MSGFDATANYRDFARRVQSERRYIHSRTTRKFLREVLRSTERRAEVLPAESYLWRAQKGGLRIDAPIPDTDDTYEEDAPFQPERMKPRARQAKEGRANPKGIPYLYTATHKATAVSEVRPWPGTVVSVAQFRPTRPLKVVNTTLHASQWFNLLGKRPRDPDHVEQWVWGDISRAFGEPTQQSDDLSEYVPTQILAELFRDAGYDGVGYRSAYGDGHNIVLFDLDVAAQVNCHIVQVREVQFTLTTDTAFGYDL